MAFIETVPEEEASGAVGDLYDGLSSALGYLPNYGRTFSIRPELFSAWVQLSRSAVAHMDPRRYELATLAAATTLRSSYCSLAHGEKLIGLGGTADEIKAIVTEPTSAGLSEQEQAIVDYATKVAWSASSVSQEDVDGLREVGLSDAEIFDIAAAVAIRCFFSTMLDAVGTFPDARYHEVLGDLAQVLQVGRPADDPT